MSEDYKLYFQRRLEETGGYPDIYQYDVIPEKLVNQIMHLSERNFGKDKTTATNRVDQANYSFYSKIYDTLVLQLGLRKLVPSESMRTKFNIIFEFLSRTKDINIQLSVIELLFRNGLVKQGLLNTPESEVGFINQLNTFFKQNGVGYQFENGHIIKIDSQFIHAEAVKPTLLLLTNPLYQNPQKEFLAAHEYYKNGDYSKTILECAKAYESTLKVIIKKHNWNYDDKDTADALTGKVVENGLFPTYLNDFFKSLKNTFKVVNTVRNNEAGHGKASVMPNIPEYLASYVLHMTASVLLFLIKAEEALP